jgi:uncharacterized protein YbjT (DUF2867 family)
MIANILTHTPIWVWGLLVLLIALGLSQTKTRRVGIARVALLPIVFTALALNSLYTSFGTNGLVFAAWAVDLIAAVAAMQALPQSASYDAKARSFTLAGSWVPLFVILAIFLSRYVIAVTFALSPQMKMQMMFGVGAGAVYGVLAAYFAGRALGLARLARASA